jgi:hypothetical protein
MQHVTLFILKDAAVSDEMKYVFPKPGQKVKTLTIQPRLVNDIVGSAS